MARLYEYADSDENSGYYIIGENGKHFQVTPDAEKLMNKLDYYPPKTENQKGPKISLNLLKLLLDIDWVFVQGEQAGDHEIREFSNDIDGGESLTNEDWYMVLLFIKMRREDDARPLADIFDADILDSKKVHLATLDEQSRKALEESVTGYIHASLNEIDDKPLEAMDTTVLKHSCDQSPSVSLSVSVRASGTEPNFRHTITSSVENGVKVVSATDAPLTWEERARMSLHRGQLFVALAFASDSPFIEFTFDESEMNGEIEHSTSFEHGVELPDEMKEFQNIRNADLK